MIHAVLTIDDGPSRITRELLAYLGEHGICPVLFFEGSHIEQRFGDAVYAVQQGAIAGNHTYSHGHLSELTYEEAVEEIARTELLLDRVYQEAGILRVHKPFRFPYGDLGGKNAEKLQKYLRENCYEKIDDHAITQPWYVEQGFYENMDVAITFSFDEWRSHQDGTTLKQIIHETDLLKRNNMCPIFEENTRHIVLIHDHPQTDVCIPGYYRILIGHLLERGVQFTAPGFI